MTSDTARCLCAGLFAGGLFATAATAAAEYRTLHSFNLTDGDHPQSGLVMDGDGNLYGTAPVGGAHNLGVVFRVAPDGTFRVLHDFKGGHDGATPSPTPLVVGPDGALYGTTREGGVANGGTLFRMKRGGKMKILHSFGVGGDGYAPASDVHFDGQGNMIGTTNLGGASDGGVVYRIAPDGTETVLHSFAGGAGDGLNPNGTLAEDGAGNLFGTTYKGGANDKGTVYKLAPDAAVSVLFGFTSGYANPMQGPTLDRHGNLFGTTTMQSNAVVSDIFMVTPKGEGSIVYRPGVEMGSTAAPMLIDRKGNLFGTTPLGGGNQTGGCFTAGGCGMFFMLAPDRTFTDLHGFGGSDGLIPTGSVVSDGHGNYYGTTMWGGDDAHGAVFEISTGAK
ncbi:MAG: hypothetical protein JOZ72_08255 [Alphaproteobacteria bacterium]|nr:hypothetical protein [Alphaproteobacteria bacterium]